MHFARPLLLTLFSWLCLSLPALFAQDGEQAFISGKVIDSSTGDPLEFANVSVMEPETEEMHSGGVTNLDGTFEIPVAPGTYNVRVDFLSYQTEVLTEVTVREENPQSNVGTVSMLPNAQMIEEIEVVSERSQVEMGLDKKVYNVSQGLARTGGSAADILDNIPSVSVDLEGNVSLRGSGGVRILIDGKPSGLVGIGDASALQLLQGNLIESIEIITNPSAKYQAEGGAGIINIILKKEEREGVNGSFDLNAGYPHNYGAAANINLRKKFFNLFGNFGGRYRQRFGNGDSEQRFFTEDTTYYTYRDRDFDRVGRGINTQVGADFFINPTNTITTSFLYRIGKDRSDRETIYRDYDEDFVLSDISSRTDTEVEDEYTLEYNLNYKKNFAKKDQVFTLDIQYQDNGEVEKSDILEQIVDEDLEPIGSDPLVQRSLNDESERRLLVQADYTHPFGEEGQIEAGYFSTLRHIDNEYRVEQLEDGEDWIILPNVSNTFDYDENIYAAYLTAGNKSGNWSYQVGLRAEYSDIGTELVQTGEVNDRSYLNFFPTAHLGYEFAGNNSLQVSYSRRIGRPRFWDLNPFFSFSDARNIRSGNPNLDPELTNSYEISHMKYWDNFSLGSSLYYRQTSDIIQRITTVKNDTTYSRPENLSDEDAFGVEVVMSADVQKWWRLNGSFNFFRSVIDGGELGEEYAADTYGWTSRFNSKMTLMKKLDFQLMFNYRSPENRPQGRRLGYAYMDLGFSMDILGDRGTLDLRVEDVFNSRRYRFITDIEGYYSIGNYQRGTTTVILGFTYRLNQKKQRGGGRRGGGYDGGGNY